MLFACSLRLLAKARVISTRIQAICHNSVFPPHKTSHWGGADGKDEGCSCKSYFTSGPSSGAGANPVG